MKRLLALILLLTVVGLITWRLTPGTRLPEGKRIDKIVIVKHDRIMRVMQGNEVIKTYRISLGRNPVGHKEIEGDKKTPEGLYFINSKNPGSAYHKNLGLSYPNDADVASAKINGRDPGGEIKIHGIRNGIGFIGKFHTIFDWTAGCIAVTDEEIDELYDHVRIGTPIEILP